MVQLYGLGGLKWLLYSPFTISSLNSVLVSCENFLEVVNFTSLINNLCTLASQCRDFYSINACWLTKPLWVPLMLMWEWKGPKRLTKEALEMNLEVLLPWACTNKLCTLNHEDTLWEKHLWAILLLCKHCRVCWHELRWQSLLHTYVMIWNTNA